MTADQYQYVRDQMRDETYRYCKRRQAISDRINWLSDTEHDIEVVFSPYAREQKIVDVILRLRKLIYNADELWVRDLIAELRGIASSLGIMPQFINRVLQ